MPGRQMNVDVSTWQEAAFTLEQHTGRGDVVHSQLAASSQSDAGKRILRIRRPPRRPPAIDRIQSG